MNDRSKIARNEKLISKLLNHGNELTNDLDHATLLSDLCKGGSTVREWSRGRKIFFWSYAIVLTFIWLFLARIFFYGQMRFHSMVSTALFLFGIYSLYSDRKEAHEQEKAALREKEKALAAMRCVDGKRHYWARATKISHIQGVLEITAHCGKCPAYRIFTNHDSDYPYIN